MLMPAAQKSYAETMPNSQNHFVISLICKDKPGIVSAVSSAILEGQGDISESQQFSSSDTGNFFMRLQVKTELDHFELEKCLTAVIKNFSMRAKITPVERPLRTLILASSAAHCLVDLLVRQMDGHLQIEVPKVISNHAHLGSMAEFYKVPFSHFAIDGPNSMKSFESLVLDEIARLEIDLVVLARFMQILSPSFCSKLEGRIINIHHSFLPGFKGANPYQQAHERGVKLIGATAHFVTSELDDGPIIEQNVVRVEHSQSPAELRAIGQAEESRTLTQAVRWFAEHRILLDGMRTIIFK